jgi:hypothetical protein
MLSHPISVYFDNQILIVYVIGVRLILWSLTLIYYSNFFSQENEHAKL